MTKRLAIEGGTPVRMAPLAPWPFYDTDEINKTIEILKSGKVNYWTGGETKAFEQEFAQYHGMKYGIALANGTLALELALIGYNIGPGDEVITTCRTFIASSSCIVRVGARPVLVDIDPVSQNIQADAIEKAITKNTKAIIPVHLAGWPCDMEKIMAIAKKYDLKVIEDCAQAHGAKINGKIVGSIGDMSAFSFCQDKIISTTGEGGILLLNDQATYERLWAFKDHGKSYDSVYRKTHPPGFRWLHDSFGTNWRMTEIQSAVGRIQLNKLSQWVEARRAFGHTLLAAFEKIKGLRVVRPSSEIYHSFYKLYVYVNPELLKPEWTRDRILAAILAEGIPCFTGSCGEIYLEKAFKDANLGPNDRLPNAKSVSEICLMFLVHPTLDQTYCADVVNAVECVMSEAVK